MNYQFQKVTYSENMQNPLYEFGVNLDSLEDEELALEGLEWHGWTAEKIEKIIIRAQTLSGAEEYDYQVEGSDFLISIDKDEVFFYDMKNDESEADIIWPFEKFVSFMEEFKKFVSEHS